MARDRLLDRLDVVMQTPVVLVCAPAGHGKSLLAASWIASRSPERIAWVGLRRCRPSQLWTTICEALARVCPEVADELRAVGSLTPAAVPERLAQVLAALDQEVLLVLDDLHSIVDLAAHEQLVELVAPGSTRLRTLVLTRHDPPWPLHRMRLDGLLDDLRTDSLAFTPNETRALFEKVGVPLPDTVLPALLARTEGWAAGLRLAALGASRAEDPAAFLAATSGRDDYIADYLMREVFDGLDRSWQTFLERIRVVDEICAPLADALGAGPDSTAQLRTLSEQNVFVHEIGDRPGWYRPHPMLLDFLRSRVGAGADTRALHRRAASWLRLHDDPFGALKHAIAAEEWPLASDLVGTHVVTWTVVQPPDELLAVLAPVPQDVVALHPGLALGIAAGRTMSGRTDGVLALVEAVRSRIDAVRGRRRRRYELVAALVQWGHHRWLGDLDAVLESCRAFPTDPMELGDLGLADWGAVRTILVCNIGLSELWTGDESSAEDHLGVAAQRNDAPPALPTLNAQAHLAYLRWRDGDLDAAEELAQRAVDQATRSGIPEAVQARCAYLALAGVALDRDDLTAVEHWLAMAESCTPEPHTALATAMLHAMLLRARGDAFGAHEVATAARSEAARHPLPSRLVEEVRALTTALRGGSPAYGDPLPSPRPTRRRQLVAELDLVTIPDGSPEDAEAALERAVDLAAPDGLRQPFLARREQVGPVLARIAHRTGHPRFVTDLVDRMADDAHLRRSTKLLSPLTDRQLNILRYLATTLSAQEIADTLYLSINTLKTHQRAIYQKLGACRRSEAIAHARDLGLI